ncbi:hypothetical protein HYG86_04225 [Alkalicella caledoniensis]|uniref:SipL SPOCS domain-containing protein n=1 Tax=Alkalicella caledoniensis TaxID=2731377 RepID=A0A7G9W5S2_ALKCA|nr:hypothetical protein [Alkalicella caledoniensis]QNO14034.1 hypothetical protein HYG86_04225 [Alkalicella caledoniensis]
MGIIRNSIIVDGLAKEEELPKEVYGQIVRSSQVETLFIPPSKSEAKSIKKVEISLNIDSNRIVRGATEKMVILGGLINYRIFYKENSPEEIDSITNIQIPFNTYMDLPEDTIKIKGINVFILDAYFHLMDSRKLYAYFVYLIELQYDDKIDKPNTNKSIEETKRYQTVPTRYVDNMLYDIDEEIM